MDQITVRQAGFADMETLLRFEQGVITAERPFDCTIKPHPVHYYDLPDLINADHIELVVAELNGELIGCGYARIEPARLFLRHAEHAYLGFMYVEPAHRGKGVNTKIIAALKNWALLRNIREMVLDVYVDNVSAVKAYEKAGFSSRHMLQMRMGL